MKKILVTGSEGYIGKHLVKMLKNKNYDVFCVDVKDEYDPKNVLTFFSDITFDSVVHLAAYVNVNESVEKPYEYYVNNICGTVSAIENLSYANFIFASTGSVEGMQSPYSISKFACEQIVQQRCNNYTIFRFYNVIGTDGYSPTNQDSLFYNLMKAEKTGTFTIFGDNYDTKDGTCVRDYIHVNEICESICKAIECPANSIENLGSGHGYTVKEIVELYKKVNVVDFEVKYENRRPGDMEYSVLGKVSNYFEKKYSIEELLKK